jgi:leader peptidase (prepilin peptidase)/N-methyltransferase
VSTLLAAFAFLFGLAFGSFLNVCIYRLPLALPEEAPDESWLRSTWNGITAWRAVQSPSRSLCPNCQHPIRWFDNFPVLSWLLLRGRCRDCGVRIRFRYTAVELLTGALFLASYLRFGGGLETVKFCVFSFLMLGLIFVDAEHRLLPDAFTVPGMLAGFLFAWLAPLTGLAPYLPLITKSPVSAPLLSLCDSLLGAVLGAAFIFGSGLAYRIARGHEGMGFGDVKMMGTIGAFLGLKYALLTILLASLLGSLYGAFMFLVVWVKRWRRYRKGYSQTWAAARRAWTSAKLVRYYAIPFGVFLGIVALFSVFLGDVVLRWYWARL